jgi:hypothetical protein
MVPGVVELLAQAGDKVTGGFLGLDAAEYRDEAGALDLDFVPVFASNGRIAGNRGLGGWMHPTSLVRLTPSCSLPPTPVPGAQAGPEPSGWQESAGGLARLMLCLRSV